MCPSQPQLQASLLPIADMATQLATFRGDLSCQPLSAEYHKLVSDGVCGSLFDALFITCVTFLCTSAFLFALTITASIAYQYFGDTVWTAHTGGGRVAAARDDDLELEDQEAQLLKDDEKHRP
jgi:hypothetical protein